MGKDELRYGNREYYFAKGFLFTRECVKKFWLRYESGSISYDALIKELMSCYTLGDDGFWWTMGNNDDIWFRCDEANLVWVQASPPFDSETLDVASRIRDIMGIDDSGIYMPSAYYRRVTILEPAQIANESKPNAGMLGRFVSRFLPQRKTNKHQQLLKNMCEAQRKREDSLERFLRQTYPA